VVVGDVAAVVLLGAGGAAGAGCGVILAGQANVALADSTMGCAQRGFSTCCHEMTSVKATAIPRAADCTRRYTMFSRIR
jgi:hypothetical protein